MNTDQHTRKDYLVFWGTCLGYALFFGYVFMSFGGTRNRYMNKRVASTVYMTHWDLYVASPLGTVAQLYRVSYNGTIELVDLRPFVPRYAWGLNRRPKIIAQELTIIVNDSALINRMKPYTVMIPYGDTLSHYLQSDTLQYTSISNPNVLHLQGKFLIAISQAHTWQQSRAGGIKDTVNVYAVNLSHN